MDSSICRMVPQNPVMREDWPTLGLVMNVAVVEFWHYVFVRRVGTKHVSVLRFVEGIMIELSKSMEHSTA